MKKRVPIVNYRTIFLSAVTNEIEKLKGASVDTEVHLNDGESQDELKKMS